MMLSLGLGLKTKFFGLGLGLETCGLGLGLEACGLVNITADQLNPFSASCSKLLLFEGFSAILV